MAKDPYWDSHTSNWDDALQDWDGVTVKIFNKIKRAWDMTREFTDNRKILSDVKRNLGSSIMILGNNIRKLNKN